MEKNNFILEIYKDKRTVFTLPDIAMLFPVENNKYLSDRVGYYVHTKKLLNPRKGIYTKSGYNSLELANILYTPSYISLEYVLQQAGVLFQFDSRITSVSYLSRELEIDGKSFLYRRIKEEIIMDRTGILQVNDTVNMATPERAFLDLLYLNKSFYFDNLQPLKRQIIKQLLPIYNSAALLDRTDKLLGNDRYQQT
jgi:hypothetical protein